MTATREDGQQPVVPLPERDPAALRAAVAKLDTAALAKFESDWTDYRDDVVMVVRVQHLGVF